MTKEEIKKAIQCGKEIVADYKADCEEVPTWVYEKLIELYEELVKEEQ